LLAARLGGTEIWKVVGAGSARLRAECIQLSDDPPSDSALSILCGESGIRPDSYEHRHVRRGDGAWNYPGFLRLCLRRPATRYDQFVERHCFSRSDWGICVTGCSGARAESVQEVVWQISMIANRVNVRRRGRVTRWLHSQRRRSL